MKKQFLAAGFVLFSFMLPLKASAAQFTGLYVFGDSLSDSGNVFNLTGGSVNPTQAIPPSPFYFNGRFSNGPNWVDYLGVNLGLQPTLFTNLNTTVPTQGINYAVGGARTGIGNALDPNPNLPGVFQQVGLFTQPFISANQKVDPNALYTVSGGANDYLFPQSNDSIQPKPFDNILQSVSLLAAAGAKNIVVLNLPDLGQIPAAKIDNRNPVSLSQSTIEFNSALAAGLNTLSQNSQLNIVSVDVNSLVKQITTNKQQFGLTNVTDACLNVTAQTVCADPNKYLYWDDFHPTTAVDKLVADQAVEAIEAKSVPEPSTVLGNLVIGVLGAGIVLKRKRQKSALTKTNRVLAAASSRTIEDDSAS
jgi:phospholipase/lecithinase/hemolysin